MEKLTTRCDAGERRYEYTSVKDRCPCCCPKPEHDNDAFEDHELANDDCGDDLAPESD
jgi:hypothetical protein